MSKNFESTSGGVGKSKSYVVLMVVIVLIAIAAIAGYGLFKKAQSSHGGDVALSSAPNIASSPLTGTPSREYVKLQEQQNVEQAKQALEEKTAAISTPTRATYLGELGQLPTGQDQKAGCGIEELRKAGAAGVLASELACRGCSAAALKASGYTAAELRNAGFAAAQLGEAGFSAEDQRKAGFSAQELKDAGITDQELKNAGFSLATGKNCDPEYLRKAHERGVSAADLKECGAAALKAAGYTAKELRDAGFSAGELRRAGFSAKELKDAGFTEEQLKEAGFSANELKDAGFATEALKKAGFSEGELTRAGLISSEPQVNCSYNALKEAYNKGVSASKLKELKECGAAALRAAGYTDKGLKDVGFSDDELRNAGFVEMAPAKNDLSSLVRLTTPGSNSSPASDELARIREQQAAQLTKQERSDKIKELQQNMLTQSADLFGSWVPLPRQQYAEGVPPTERTTQGSQSGQKGEGAGGSAAVVGEISKAGTIFYAVLDTGINSDEQSPILATIVQGKYKGAKVLGKFDRVEKKVVLQFTTINVPGLDHSILIDAYAIDPNTARTALASDVDSHYFLRYGMLFASSFVAGLGDAITDSGSVSINFSDGSVSTQNSTLDTKEKLLSALGEVGTKFGDETSSFIDTPPTVKVDAGSTIGLLLMKDLTVPNK
jgi:intracellular multiplication protein IcmE